MNYSSHAQPDSQNNIGDPHELFPGLKNIREKHANHIIIGHLNINSLGAKISEVRELQNRCKFDVLVISETKLDGSYKQKRLT